MRVVRNPSDIEFEPFAALAGCWFRKRGPDGLPVLGELLSADDPLRDYRMTVIIGDNPRTVFYSEVGEVLESLYGEKIAGKSLDELFNHWFRKQAYEGYEKLITEPPAGWPEAPGFGHRNVAPREAIHCLASSAAFMSASRSLKLKATLLRQSPLASRKGREKVAEKNGPFCPSLSQMAARTPPARRVWDGFFA